MLDILNHSSIVKENMQRVEHISDPVIILFVYNSIGLFTRFDKTQ